MSDDTPWGRFPHPTHHPAFGKAYSRLDTENRAAADAAIGAAADRMHALLEHPLCRPMPWKGLDVQTARTVDMAERTCIAMGVFRLSIAGRLGSQRTMLSDGLDQAADNVDRRAGGLAVHALAERYPHLETVKVGESAAYHRLLNHVARVFPGQGFAVAQAQSEMASGLDLTLETGLDHGVLGSLIAHQSKIRQDVREATNGIVAQGQMPLEPAVALWLLAVMGLGQVFGEDDNTLAYAD